MRLLTMPSKYSLNVSLTEHLGGFVASQVASGRFGTASEVVRAGLRLLEREMDARIFDDRPRHREPDAAMAAADGKNVAGVAKSGNPL